MEFIRNTLLYVQLPEEDIQRKVQDCLHLLLSKEYIKIGSKTTEPDSISYEATTLGVATFKGMLGCLGWTQLLVLLVLLLSLIHI